MVRVLPVGEHVQLQKQSRTEKSGRQRREYGSDALPKCGIGTNRTLSDGIWGNFTFFFCCDFSFSFFKHHVCVYVYTYNL